MKLLIVAFSALLADKERDLLLTSAGCTVLRFARVPDSETLKTVVSQIESLRPPAAAV